MSCARAFSGLEIDSRRCLGLLCLGAALLLLSGCGGQAAHVAGRVTCQGKAVTGTILFTPHGEGANNSGPPVSAELKDDGRFSLTLRSIGKHNVLVSPRDVKYPPPKDGFDYPCDRSPLERDITAGDNNVTIELATRTQ